FYIHHGDGLGPGDRKNKFLIAFFRSQVCQWIFARLHPNLGIGIAHRLSSHSRAAGMGVERFPVVVHEWLIQYAKEILQQEHFDYFIFGHPHLPYAVQLSEKSHIVNLGEWMHSCTYAVWDGKQLALKQWMP